ncbi:Pyrroline-5-carboxylate reductase [Pyricularia oryzae]|uniref:Pyrroline-5-carboxylate reductase n=1 Tax=Pyricularia oryzae TaxID=318829 RepID=A0A4P7NHI2_PYROR|nr:Pyrroline-5-carboxylate reductase [Pyricularia oryzae]KAI6361879.1 Pyrroline-5-carboxylate reductase [Pyricularia oryzae]KAI6366906.1 Pyrroline-5-carboxylate reductase [Pyricularia oryzae]KAI6397490.1 Pyrroline-5-carboxylate reductase [Pyricularia oryzae]KAI6427323.1 Pyrroline-5-carboxylate reductase [Pyricularia oryzae]
MLNTPSDGELTLAVLGCGTMGIAILSGILTSLQDMAASGVLSASASGTSTPVHPEVPDRLPSRFIACVRRPESAKKVKVALAEHLSVVKVVQNDNLASVRQAGVVILACKPQMIGDLLSKPGIAEALRGKLLISICAGVTVPQIEGHLEQALGSKDVENPCRVVRAMPNTASMIRESMTVVATTEPPLPPQVSSLVTWIFKRIGDVVYLPASTMDASTALCGSGPAFFALMLEAAVDGAVAMGLPRAEALRMAAQTMKGTAALVQHGDHPALLRDKVSTPGGCTIGGLLVLEEGIVRGTVARAVREATVVASQLGQGVQGVNGTRPMRH